MIGAAIVEYSGAPSMDQNNIVLFAVIVGEWDKVTKAWG